MYVVVVGVVKTPEGCLVAAYSLKLHRHTSKEGKAQAMSYGLEWCISNGVRYIVASAGKYKLMGRLTFLGK